MRRSQERSHPPRAGFTLVELLVVIFIIAVLISLTAAAVMRVRDKGPEIRARNDITGLSAAINAFHTDFQVDYIPSAIILREDGRYGDNPIPALRQLEINSENYLKKLWPRLAVAGRTMMAPPNSRTALPGGGLDWNGNGLPDFDQAFVLEGDQCLVFFLGGIQTPPTTNPPGVLGFSNNRTDPTRGSGASAARKGPFYEFQSDRLAYFAVGSTPFGVPGAVRAQFFSYRDAWGNAPYAYFSSRSLLAGGSGYNPSDCACLTMTSHYYTSSGALERSGFQIISAGRNGQFGTGGLFDPAFGLGENLPGSDDFANFHPMALGSGTR